MRTQVEGSQAVNLAIAAIQTDLWGSSGAYALARVLLHAYNTAQPLDISLLGVLNPKHEEWAWAILKLRVEGIEPHEVVKDRMGFHRIVEDYWIDF